MLGFIICKFVRFIPARRFQISGKEKSLAEARFLRFRIIIFLGLFYLYAVAHAVEETFHVVVFGHGYAVFQSEIFDQRAEHYCAVTDNAGAFFGQNGEVLLSVGGREDFFNKVVDRTHRKNVTVHGGSVVAGLAKIHRGE